jgi:6-phosphogluconate dehydrogenase
MGSNLARNLAHHGNTVALYNRHYDRTEKLMAEHGSEGKFVPSKTVEEFVASLSKPRTAIIMVKAGAPTDAVINELADAMEPGDIIVDGGNSYFMDTIRREKDIRARGFHYVGCGVSGGEEGALNGPSMMPGGTEESWQTLGPILKSIAAVAEGEPCVTHIGENGAGHFVKMVHNGIEYADMQLIAESYDLMRRGLGLEPGEIADVFGQWNTTELNSYLIEITAEVLHQTDAKTGKPLVDLIVDHAGMKGTGTWTVQTALSLAIPVTGIAEAVFARGLSSQAEQREEAAKQQLTGPSGSLDIPADEREAFIEDIRHALYASKIVAYAQGFDEINAGAKEYDWKIDLAAVARIWRGGCIIRAQFLNVVSDAFESGEANVSLLFAPYFKTAIEEAQESWRRVVARAATYGIPVPAFSSSLSYYDGLRSKRLPAALIQGQRDFFGAHTYGPRRRPRRLPHPVGRGRPPRDRGVAGLALAPALVWCLGAIHSAPPQRTFCYTLRRCVLENVR